MVSYELPKPQLPLLARARESVRLAFAFMKGDRTAIADITSATQFSPLQPISPSTPGIRGRLYDYQTGLNVQYLPRGYGSNRIQFGALRQFSRNCEIARLVMEKVKDQITAYKWQFMPKENAKIDGDDPRIDFLTEFFKKPDKINPFGVWLRMVLEDFMAIDAVTIYRVKDRVGRPYSFEIFDGGTIKPLIDADGRRPLAPDAAFQQVIKGAPRANYTTDEMLYSPRNLMPDDPTYGYSLIEQSLMTIEQSMQRQKYQLAYFTEGSVPDSYMTMADGMTPDQIREFEDNFNDILSGNAKERRKVPFVPFGSKIEALKAPILKDDFDEWIARILCFNFGLAPTAFIKQMNRATADSDQERAEQEGQLPKMQYIKVLMDTLIGDFGPEFSDIEFRWQDSKNQDPKEQADVETSYVKVGVKTINEARLTLGLDPSSAPEADTLLVYTPTGFVPLDAFEQQQATQQANAQLQAEAKASQPAPGEEPHNHGDSKDPNEKAYGRVRKAVRHKAVPFVDHT